MPETNTPPALPTPATDPVGSIDARLDKMIEILDRMNRRDRWRTIGGFFRGAVVIIPTLVIILSSIWLYFYGSNLVQDFIQQTTNQAAEQAQESFMDRMLEGFQIPQQQQPVAPRAR
ncbi:MAG: hypothetical protein KBC95_01440 [Candidatus Peribacteraceae bacterium]|nr:hypothetical protein [Candidatus Peribacteraceae bacterium]